jgi:hypothetical protein
VEELLTQNAESKELGNIAKSGKSYALMLNQKNSARMQELII